MLLALSPLADPRPVRASIAEVDDVTLARAQRGDDAAARTLYHRYKAAVFAMHWRVLGRRASQAIVDDLTQETFVQVFRSLPRFSPAGPARLSTWILTIGIRVALGYLRGLAPTEVEADGSAGDADEVPATTGGDRALREAIVRALEQIGAEQRVVVVLCDYHELAYEEAAEALGVPVGTVRSRLSRARVALRELLKEWS